MSTDTEHVHRPSQRRLLTLRPEAAPGFVVKACQGIMIPTVDEDENHRGRTRYTLTETEHGHAWGLCVEAQGLFGNPRRGTYAMLSWVPEGPEVPGGEPDADHDSTTPSQVVPQGR
ncbi:MULTISPECIES: hypothetical protein [unclassified Streptomyces]|uniref:hypothetical protein n=1 Tax=unclassified Streptomyces TaxID=2593676 RepID=UPI00037AA85E|nr:MULTISPECIES: hypothetical protein [unclassified Streptomyces]MYT29536.1 hypothetical protein [Streptomyces sp. SID8354]